MAANTKASPLLALPLELRIEIYKELLGPNPARVHTLYHDRRGREASFDIHPSILRVNKQTYSEAISVLYDTVSVRIYLGTPAILYPDNIEPPELFRNETPGAVKSTDRLEWPTSPPTVEDLESDRRLEPAVQGYIYSHCFRRLRKIELATSCRAIWRDSRCGSYISLAGQIVLRILKLLAQEQVTKPPVMKRFRFILPHSQSVMRSGEMDKRMKAIVGLLKALKRRVDAEIEFERGDFKETLNNWNMEETEIDDWDKWLMADG